MVWFVVEMCILKFVNVSLYDPGRGVVLSIFFMFFLNKMVRIGLGGCFPSGSTNVSI